MKRTFVILTSCLLLGGIAMLSADNYVDDAYYWPKAKKQETTLVGQSASASTTATVTVTTTPTTTTTTATTSSSSTALGATAAAVAAGMSATAAPKEKIEFIQVTDTVVKAVIRK